MNLNKNKYLEFLIQFGFTDSLFELFDKETPAGYSTYIVNKNGLKYNVTLKVADV
jgi:hypothetical protein